MIGGTKFSKVRLVNPAERAEILSRAACVDSETSSRRSNAAVDEQTQKDNKLIDAVKELLREASSKLNQDSHIISTTTRRSIPVPSLRTALTMDEINRTLSSKTIFGTIPEHDPDYDVAVHLSARLQHAKTMSRMSNRASEEHDDNRSEKYNRGSLAYPQQQQPLYMAEANIDTADDRAIEKLINSLNAEKDAAALLRLGVDRSFLSEKAGEIYASFLSDIIDLSKRRAASSTSIEEMAMHRALAEHVSKSLLASRDIGKVRLAMINAAVEASLLTTQHL